MTLRILTKPTPDSLAQILAASGSNSSYGSVNKFGENPSIANGDEEEIWDGGAVYVFPATALMTKISQTTDQAAMQGGTIEVQGLDANWDAVTQTATLDASDTTTAVTLTTPLIRCFRMKNTTASVVNDSPIRVHNDAEDQDYAIMSANNNQTLMAIYTVPNGKTAYMTRYSVTINAGVGNPTSCIVKLWATDNDNSYPKQIKHTTSVDLDFEASADIRFDPFYKFTQKTDIFITANPSGAAANITASFDLYLVNN